jgi:hypothetical protein
VTTPCLRCGALLHTGEARVIVGFTVAELVELLYAGRGGPHGG